MLRRLVFPVALGTAGRVGGSSCFWVSDLTQQAIVCYNRKAGHGQMLRVVGCRELDGPNFLTVSCR